MYNNSHKGQNCILRNYRMEIKTFSSSPAGLRKYTDLTSSSFPGHQETTAHPDIYRENSEHSCNKFIRNLLKTSFTLSMGTQEEILTRHRRRHISLYTNQRHRHRRVVDTYTLVYDTVCSASESGMIGLRRIQPRQ